MATYRLTMTIEAPMITQVKTKLKQAFGNDLPIYELIKNETPESRSARLNEAESKFEDAKSTVEELKDEMATWRDSVPESLQGGDKYSEIEACVEALEKIQNELDSISFGDVSFPKMY